ncbi:MAG: MOSC domain-containing protein [Candidatus Limnocylindrales bacterium]
MAERPRVVWLATAPVKAMALAERDEVEVGPSGIAGDRQFLLIDPSNRLVAGKRLGPLATIVPMLGHDPETLALRFPDGSVTTAAIELGAVVNAVLYHEERPAHELDGPFSARLSEWAGQPLRLVRVDAPSGGIDRGPEGGGFTIISRGSLQALAAAGRLDEPLDPRRFRMSAVVDGIGPYAEEAWLGRRVRLGEVVLAPHGNVGRCAVTTHDPDTGRRSLDTLQLLAETRGDVPTTEALPFGVWATVLAPGRIRLGDEVTLLD